MAARHPSDPGFRRRHLARRLQRPLRHDPDANPILDRSPTVTGLFWAAGFSGHGFKLAPVTGRMVAELALHGQRQDHPIERLRLSRFAQGEPLLAEHLYRDTARQ